MTPYAPYPLNLLRNWTHRGRWWIRLASSILLLPLFGYFAFTRLTAHPVEPVASPDFDLGVTAPAPEVDRTAHLVTALNGLPGLPTLMPPTTSPTGFKWVWKTGPGTGGGPPAATSLGIESALEGTWDPQRRLNLREAVTYFSTPTVAASLDEIASLITEPFCLTDKFMSGASSLAQLRQLAKMLTARARYHLEDGRYPAAARDIEAVLAMSGEIENDGTLIRVLVGMACRALPSSEVRLWAMEGKLQPEQCADLMNIFARRAFTVEQAWHAALTGEIAWALRRVDNFYTRDPRGNGHVVVYSGPAERMAENLFYLGNLFSPLFDDRRTAEAAVMARHDALMKVPELPAQEVQREAGALAELPLRPTDIAVRDDFASMRRMYELCLRCQVNSADTLASLALYRFRHRHGAYPDRLDQLVPDLLPELPADPFSGQPLCYRKTDDGGFLLYSVGENGVDDGGDMKRYTTQSGQYREPLDLGYSTPRGEPTAEWVLIPAATQTGAAQP
ncbi:MAG: hypothetical protein AMXMBFR13_34020 [Phycisphaerae bacterium]